MSIDIGSKVLDVRDCFVFRVTFFTDGFLKLANAFRQSGFDPIGVIHPPVSDSDVFDDFCGDRFVGLLWGEFFVVFGPGLNSDYDRPSSHE